MSFVSGSLRILYIKVNGLYVAVGCLTANNFSESSETLDTTTRDNAGWSTFRPTNQSYQIDFSGIQDPADALTYAELKEYKRARTLLEWKIEATAAGLIDYGYGYITEISETAEAGSNLTYNGVLRGYGKPVELGDNAAPTAPTLNALITTTSGTAITAVGLSWSGATDDVAVTGYEVRIVGSDGSTEIVNVGDVSIYTYYGLQQGFTYAFNVRAYDIASNYSPWSNKRLLDVPIAGDVADQTKPMLFQNGITKQYQDGTAAQYQ